MYLDDGVSRNSAPTNSLANKFVEDLQQNGTRSKEELGILSPDAEAADQYMEVKFVQAWVSFFL